MLTIVVTTYLPKDPTLARRRHACLNESVYSLWEYLVGDECRLHIADDSETPNQIDLSHIPFSDITYSNSGHQGIGASLNRALDHLGGSDKWLYTTDDWLLEQRLDLIPALRLLDHYKYAVVRVGPIHPDLECTSRFNQDVGWWLDLKGLYAFATRPFVATKDFYTNVGPFKEHVDSYECESDYAVRANRMAIAAIMEYHHIWTHLGEDYSVGLHERPS